MDDRVDFDGACQQVQVAGGHWRVGPALLHLHSQALVQQRRQLPAPDTHALQLGLMDLKLLALSQTSLLHVFTLKLK